MQSGVAKLLKDAYPDCFKNYEIDLLRGYGLGNVSWTYLYSSPESISRDLVIASCITQEFYGRDPDVRYVSYDAVSDAFDVVFEQAKADNWVVNLPKIGAGLGNGDWFIIERLIIESARKYNFDQKNIIVWEL